MRVRPTYTYGRRVKRQNRLIVSVFIALGVLVMSYGLYVGMSPTTKHYSILPPTIAAGPSSVKPTAKEVANYTVPPSLPRYISIPSIDVGRTRVIQLGNMTNGQIAAPDNVYDTGWYIGSAKPGEPGAMFIYGHVSSWTSDGVFYNLKKLQPGDLVNIVRGDNRTFNYQVISSKVYPASNVNMHEVLSTINNSKQGLNLMTCTGSIKLGTSEFTERLVVFTKLVQP